MPRKSLDGHEPVAYHELRAAVCRSMCGQSGTYSPILPARSLEQPVHNALIQALPGQARGTELEKDEWLRTPTIRGRVLVEGNALQRRDALGRRYQASINVDL